MVFEEAERTFALHYVLKTRIADNFGPFLFHRLLIRSKGLAGDMHAGGGGAAAAAYQIQSYTVKTEGGEGHDEGEEEAEAVAAVDRPGAPPPPPTSSIVKTESEEAVRDMKRLRPEEKGGAVDKYASLSINSDWKWILHFCRAYH
jgi:hypothetical protein